MVRRTALAMVGLATALITATSSMGTTPADTPSASRPGVQWSGLERCSDPDLDGLDCGVLTVPVDWNHPGGRRLDLEVAVGGSRTAKRTLLMLSGGPGQPGPSLMPHILPALAGVSDDMRIVMLDQRGTGAHALDCPDLQAQRGGADLMMATRDAVRSCARTIGPDRSHFHTTDSIADYEALRRALGVSRWSVDGVSYGTYTASRYAAAHPGRIDRVVLDSPVPLTGFDATLAEIFPDFARVMRAVCATPGRDCPGDPADDLHALLERRPELGPGMLNLVTTAAYIDSATLIDLPERLHAAAGGDDGPVQEYLDDMQEILAAPADEYSQAIQATTLCADLTFPWGGAASPESRRDRVADRAVAALDPERLFPFNREAARDNGEMSLCEDWPRMADRPVPVRDLRVRSKTLILAGELDLGTPLTWARRAHREIAGSRLVVVPDAGHSIQIGREHPDVNQQVADFLLH